MKYPYLNSSITFAVTYMRHWARRLATAAFSTRERRFALRLAVFMLLLLGLLINAAHAAPNRGAVYVLNTSAYNSLSAQTDSSPFVTATGTRTRPGVLAVSRDLLRSGIPHGTSLRVLNASGCGLNIRGQVYRVEDTMGPRAVRSADIWLASRSQARTFGRCRVTFQVL